MLLRSQTGKNSKGLSFYGWIYEMKGWNLESGGTMRFNTGQGKESKAEQKIKGAYFQFHLTLKPLYDCLSLFVMYIITNIFVIVNPLIVQVATA